VPRAGVTSELLVQAAAELADEAGLEQVTASALARRFGVTVASLYSHIESVAALRAAVAALALNELADQAAAALAGRAGKDALVAFAGAYRDYASAHPGRYAAALSRLSPAVATPEMVAAGRRHTELNRAVLRGYGIPESGQTAAIRLIGSTVHGYLSLEAAGGFAYTDDVDDSWPQILAALDVALRNWPAP